MATLKGEIVRPDMISGYLGSTLGMAAIALDLT